MNTESLGEAAAILTGQAPEAEAETPEAEETEQTAGEILLATEKAETDESEETPIQWTAKGLAERLDVEPSEIYQVEIDVGDGEKRTLGDIKDRFKDLKRAEKILEDAQDTKAEFERDYLVKTQALNQRESGKALSDDEIKAFEDQRDAAMAVEAEKLVQIRPELADKDTALKASGRVTELLGEYGINPWEAEQLYDSRLTLAFLRLADLEDRLAAAKEAEVRPKRKQKPKGVKKDGSSAGGIVDKVKSGRMSQTEGVAALLTGGQ